MLELLVGHPPKSICAFRIYFDGRWKTSLELSQSPLGLDLDSNTRIIKKNRNILAPRHDTIVIAGMLLSCNKGLILLLDISDAYNARTTRDAGFA